METIVRTVVDTALLAGAFGVLFGLPLFALDRWIQRREPRQRNQP